MHLCICQTLLSKATYSAFRQYIYCQYVFPGMFHEDMKIFFFYICAFSCHRRHAFISDPLPVIRVPTRRRYGNVTGGHAQPTAEHRGGHTQKRSPPDEEQVHTHLSHVLQLMHQCACSHLTFYLHVAGRRRASVAKKRKNMLSAWRIASLCWKTRTRLS